MMVPTNTVTKVFAWSFIYWSSTNSKIMLIVTSLFNDNTNI